MSVQKKSSNNSETTIKEARKTVTEYTDLLKSLKEKTLKLNDEDYNRVNDLGKKVNAVYKIAFPNYPELANEVRIDNDLILDYFARIIVLEKKHKI